MCSYTLILWSKFNGTFIFQYLFLLFLFTEKPVEFCTVAAQYGICFCRPFFDFWSSRIVLGKHSQITFIFEVLVFFLFISRIANIFLVMFCIAKTNIYNILIETIDVCVIWLFYVLVKLIFINFKINHILICDICAMILKHMAGCFLSNT